MNSKVAQPHVRGRGSTGEPADALKHSQILIPQAPSYLPHVSSTCCWHSYASFTWTHFAAQLSPVNVLPYIIPLCKYAYVYRLI